MKPIVPYILMASSAVAGTTDDSVDDAKFVEYAKGFAPYTARVRGVGSDEKVFEATGTIIGGEWVVTAAHVIAGARGVTVEAGGKKSESQKIFVHGEWRHEEHGWHDIALAKLSTPIDLDFYPAVSSGEERIGQAVSIAGYGIHGKLSKGHSQWDGKLRAGTQTIERFERTVIVCSAAHGSSPLEFCISPGDSGGPLFAGGKLAGINSFTMAAKGPLKSKAGEETAHTRVSLYADWIRETMEGNK